MKTLNLQYPERSDIKYNIIKFPDGELQLDIETPLINFKDEIVIRTRIASMNDLFVLLQATNILERFEISYYVQIMYLMTQRTDRLFSYGRPLSLKVMMGMLNQIHGHIQILEPHNIDAIKNYSLASAINYKHEALSDYGLTIMFPDKGALNRYMDDDDKENLFPIYGEKQRDVDTGKIIGYKININGNTHVCEITIVDDLCDGGGTFLMALEQLRKLYPKTKINLEVVHAVQEAGIRKVCEAFDKVTVTNSYADWDKLNIPNLKVIDVFNLDL